MRNKRKENAARVISVFGYISISLLISRGSFFHLKMFSFLLFLSISETNWYNFVRRLIEKVIDFNLNYTVRIRHSDILVCCREYINLSFLFNWKRLSVRKFT